MISTKKIVEGSAILVLLFIIGCVKESPLRLPVVITSDLSSITSESAICVGEIHSIGVTEYGVCWSKSQNPTISDQHVSEAKTTAKFSLQINGLNPKTLYYIRAFGINSSGISYGNQMHFTTIESGILPSLTTLTVTNISQSTAVGGGNISGQGSASVISRGLCFSTLQNPTISGPHTTDGSGTGSFSSNLTGLVPNTIYHVRAYASNSYGYAYGNQIQFTTLAVNDYPTVTTTEPSQINQNTAISGGNVISEGGSSVTTRGVCWDTLQNPTTINLHTTNGSGAGNFISDLAGLLAGTTYYIRAYATNSTGTSYGNQVVCTTTGDAGFASVITGSASNVTETTAISVGEVTSEGSSAVSVRGVCWSTSQNPTNADSHTVDGGGTGTFSSELATLNSNTLYYIRAYAINSKGIAYGAQRSFYTLGSVPGDPCPGTPAINDSRDGKVYPTIQIGSQCWLKKNMNVGTRINIDQTQNPNQLEKYCYSNLETNCNEYGGLYQWDEMMQGSETPGSQGICPLGWHIPTDEEWTTLTIFLGGAILAGGKMKEQGTLQWLNPNTGATNESGFAALPGGYGFFAKYGFLSINAVFWTSSATSVESAWDRILYCDYAGIGRKGTGEKTFSNSVRCIRD